METGSGASSSVEQASSKNGVIGKRDDHDCVIFKRRFHHPVAKVWAAIAEPAQRAIWLPGIRFDPKPDSRFDIWFGGECEGPAHVSGLITAFEEMKVLQLGSIRFELEPLGDECTLTFSDVLWYDEKRTKRQFAISVLGGWHRFLDLMELWLDEERTGDLPEPDYSSVHIQGLE